MLLIVNVVAAVPTGIASGIAKPVTVVPAGISLVAVVSLTKPTLVTVVKAGAVVVHAAEASVGFAPATGAVE